jgi:hypothetical protein
MRRRQLTALLGIALLAGLMLPVPAGAGATTLYVDGKQGSDSNSGRSPSDAFKTIARASASIPAGFAGGWTVVVQGYTDYVYRERPVPSAFSSYGSSTARVVYRAAGYAAGSNADYVKPIVSGGDVAPVAGQRWSTTSYPGVWRTPWSVEPYFFGKLGGTIKSAAFQDGRTWLWEQTSLSALAGRAKSGLGGFWWDRSARQLYVTAVGSPGSGTDPSRHVVDVIVRPTFYFKGTQGVRYVEVRGFEVRHSANGVAFDNGTDYSVAADNVLNANFLMGATTAGVQTANGPDQAVGNVISRNRGSWNTLQLIKIDEGSQNGTVCDNIAANNALRGILVQGKAPGTTYTGFTSGILVCRNALYSHRFNPTGSTYNNASGITVANDARNVTLDDNDVWSNDVGIHLTQERAGLTRLDNIVLRHNRVSGNRRFGLNIYDGVYGDGAGKVSVTGDVYWGNGTGVMVAQGSTNKSISQTTIHGSYADGVRVGVVNLPAARLTLTRSLVTGNGGYGLWLVTGSAATLGYDGFSASAKGSIKGSPAKTAVNTQSAGYLSISPASPSYLRIATSSYQYTAGPGSTPIGARY